MKVGILGGGQLGQMLMLAGYPLDIQASSFEQSDAVPAARVGDVIIGRIDETEKLHDWARKCDVITYEFENFPAELVSHLAEVRPVLPSPGALAAAQDRWAEKRLFDELDIPVAPFRLIANETDIKTAMRELQGPYVFKTRTGGYDGKGQAVVEEDGAIDAVLELLKDNELIAEEKLRLDTEVSIIGVRGADGTVEMYPITVNEHRQGVLHKSSAPARLSQVMIDDAKGYMLALLKRLQYVGVLALEMFVVGDRLVANEMAPRVHNSGHWTIEGAETSQFENHMRAVAGLPLGSAALIAPTVMINLIGAVPPTKTILRIAGAHLHLYGKDARPGRKLGHITITAPDAERLRQRVSAVENVVKNVLA